MIDPNQAFLYRKCSRIVEEDETDITHVIIETFFAVDKPPEMIGIIGIKVQALQNCALVRGRRTDIETHPGAGVKIRKEYVSFVNGLVYNYTERLMASSYKSKLEFGIMFVRAQDKEE